MASKQSGQIVIYTDGACSGNPGPGGWGAVLLWNGHEKRLSGGEAYTTNNRMELIATIEALKTIKKSMSIVIYTDSQYVKNGITSWMPKWLRTNWRNGAIKNADLWKQLYELTTKYEVQWKWVRGHSGNVYNELADQLAREMIPVHNKLLNLRRVAENVDNKMSFGDGGKR